MASVAARFTDTLARMFLRDALITKTHDLSAHFRRIEMAFPWLKGVGVSAGDKVQLRVPGEGMRTYTPYRFDDAAGVVSFLAYVHGDGPGARWARAVEAGHRVRVFGPRGSLALSRMSGPVVLFGDETSFAAAASLAALRSRAPSDVGFVFEASSASESAVIIRELALPNVALVEKTAGDGHFEELEKRLREKLSPSTQLVMTGRAQSIQAMRGALKSPPVSYTGQKVKAYWSVGKTGLD